MLFLNHKSSDFALLPALPTNQGRVKFATVTNGNLSDTPCLVGRRKINLGLLLLVEKTKWFLGSHSTL